MVFILKPDHIALTSSTNINEICKPLKSLGITYFSFVRTYADGSHIRLSNNPDWTQHYYSRGFYEVVLNQIPDSDGNILWSAVDKYPLFYEAAEYYNIDNGTVLILKFSDIIERYFFGATKSNIEIRQLYIKHQDLLMRFILYFKDAAHLLIAKAEKSKIYLPLQNHNQHELIDNSLLENFLNDTNIEKVCIRINGQDIYISNNEAKILALMKHGLTAKEISTEIGLSPKTIEIYTDKLKAKLCLYSRANLLIVGKSNKLLNKKILVNPS